MKKLRKDRNSLVTTLTAKKNKKLLLHKSKKQITLMIMIKRSLKMQNLWL